MRKYAYPGAAIAAAALLTAVCVGPASADGTDVLTAGSGNAAVGDTISAGLASGASTTLSTSLGNIVCTTSGFTSTVGTNPASTGTSDVQADETLTGLTFDNCTTDIFGATGVNSITLDSASSTAVTVDDNDGSGNPPTLTLTPTVDAVLNTIFGPVTCVYSGTVAGTISNSAQTIAFDTQSVTAQAGSSSLCPSSGTYTATFGPTVDDTVLTNGSPTPLTVN